MKDLPEKLEPGGAIEEKITSKLINAMLAAIRRCQPPEQVKGGRIGTGPGGWTLAIDPGGSGAVPPHPFKIVQSAPNKIKFHYGLVNGNPPVIVADPLTIDIAESPDLTLAGTAFHNLFIKTTIDASFNLISQEIVAIAPSIGPATETEGYAYIGRVQTVDDVITNISQTWKTNCTYFYCGEDDHLFFL